MISHSLNMIQEAKEVREFADRQEARCLGLLDRLSRIQIHLLDKHTQEQMNALVSQPPKKFGISTSRTRTSSLSTPKCELDNRGVGITRPTEPPVCVTPPPSPSTSIASDYCASSSPYIDTLPNVITKVKEPKKRKRNILHDSPLWKIPDISDMQHTSSSLESIVRQASMGNLDLDETESSSGDSSCDETLFIQEEVDGTPRRLTHYLPVEDNPSYKFATDRAKIISMWTWLQDAIANLSYKIRQQDELAKHLIMAKPAFQFEEQQIPTAHRASNSRPPSNAALKDACIQIFTANNDSQIPPTSTQVFYAGEREAPYITDATGKVIQLVPPPPSATPTESTSQKLSNVDNNKVSTTSPQFFNQERKTNSIVGGGLESLGLTIPINHDPSCTARRCMPLKPFKPRKIYQLGGIHNLSSFSGRVPTILCTCFGRNELCAVCTGRARKTDVIEAEVMDPKEIHELLDHNYHRTLSLPEETPIATLIESALKREGWTGRRLRKKMKFKRLVMNLAKSRDNLHRYSQLEEDIAMGLKKRPRGRPRLTRSVDEFGHVKIKNSKRIVSLSPPKQHNWRKPESRNPISRRASYGGDVGFPRNNFKYTRKKYNSVSCAKGLRRKDRDIGMSDDDALFDTDYQNYEDFIVDGFSSNKSDKRFSQTGRKLNQDYDIDNIVIPYSIASSTRVEKIEYKEILTPSWRVVSDVVTQGTPNEVPTEEEDETETQMDLSEDAIRLRHDRCEVDEHKKFNSVPDKVTSRRSRRVDSRTESLELPLSNPGSPGVVDTTQDVSVSLSPSSPLEGLGEEGLSDSFGITRRRTISSTSRRDEDDWDEPKMEVDSNVHATPFEPRRFPLTDEEYKVMNEGTCAIESEVEDLYIRPRRISPIVDIIHCKEELDMPKDGDMELMDMAEESDVDEEDDPDWHIAPGERVN